MRRFGSEDTLCPIARAADLIADRWTILILRELRMRNDRFDGIQAQTGMSSNLLTRRLKFMEEEGLIERHLYHERPKRYAYRITDMARELDGMMLTLRQWGMRHCGFDPQAESAVTMIHRRTGADIDADWQPSGADLPFSFSQVESRINSGWASERAARAQAFAMEKRDQVARRSSGKSAAKSRRTVKRKKGRTAASER
jgi:DNA-binding HxlR family transcriptional regulator